MEYVVGGVIVVIALLAIRGAGVKKTGRETDEERKLRETDEIVTVILPTINHDK